MKISVGSDKLTKKIKYFIIIVITCFATLFFEQIFLAAKTYNVPIDTEWLLLNSVDYIINGKFRNTSEDICYITKVDMNTPLLENMYYVEKKLEYEEFKRMKLIPTYSIDDETLHRMFLDLQDRFKWSIWDGQSSFYKRIREYFMKKPLKKYKETSPYFILEKNSGNASFYIIFNNFYKKQNENRNYYMIQIYMQNNDNFVYLSHFGWGELVGNYRKEYLTDKFDQVYNHLFFKN